MIPIWLACVAVVGLFAIGLYVGFRIGYDHNPYIYCCPFGKPNCLGFCSGCVRMHEEEREAGEL